MAAILAGGQSRRFGQDKVLATLNGKTLFDTMLSTLQCSGFDILISTNRSERFTGRPFRVIEDTWTNEGPLQALYGLLQSVAAKRLLLVPVDMPLISTKLLSLLWETSSQGDISAFEIEGRTQPLPAVYSKMIVKTIEAALRQGRRDLRVLFEGDLVVRAIGAPTWRQHGISDVEFLNINTPSDLEQALSNL